MGFNGKGKHDNERENEKIKQFIKLKYLERETEINQWKNIHISVPLVACQHDQLFAFFHYPNRQD